MGGGQPLVLRPFAPVENPSFMGHVFKPAGGHVNPPTLISQVRYARLFQDVAANPANLRANASGLLPSAAVQNGAQAYTWTARNGKQVWVFERNGAIYDAGVNAAGAHR